MHGTDSITWSWSPISFLSNSSRLTAFNHAFVSCLHLKGPGKVCKWNGGLHSSQSPFFLQLPSTSRLCSVQVSFFHLLILSVLFEQPITLQFNFGVTKNMLKKTTMILKLRLAFDVYTSFSQVIWEKALHNSDFLTPLATNVFKNIMAHSYGK